MIRQKQFTIKEQATGIFIHKLQMNLGLQFYVISLISILCSYVTLLRFINTTLDAQLHWQ